MPFPKRPRKPKKGVPAPPSDDQRCTGISARTGERCTNWRMKSDPEGRCSGHAHQPMEALRRGRSEQVAADRAEREQVALRGAEGQLLDAKKRLEEVDPLDIDAFQRALSHKEAAELEVRRLLHEQQAKQVAKLEPPPRTPEMAAAGTFWEKVGLNPAHLPDDAIYAGDGTYFRWEARPGHLPRNLAHPDHLDPDAERLRVERLEAADAAQARAREREAAALIALYQKVSGNPYALRHEAGRAGVDCDVYLADLESRLADVYGAPVDLDGPISDVMAVIWPALERQAERNAWSGLSVARP